MEELLIDQLDGTIEIPETLNFVCTDRSQLLDQLKVLQMVLRKERDKNGDSSLTTSQSSRSLPGSSLTSVSDAKEDLKEKVERHKKMMEQKRQDKLKQMDEEAEALSRALDKEEGKSSENIKVGKVKLRKIY